MAVINCPKCRKKISDKAKSCQHCNVVLEGLDEEKLAHIKGVSMIEASQRLMTHSMIAMLLFCGGVLFLFWHNAQPGTWQYITSVSATGLGFVLYIVTRIRLIFLKKRKK